jgi:putative transposase
MSHPKSPPTSAQLWQSRIHAWQQSGQSARQFCEKHQLAVASFYQWRHKLSVQFPAAEVQGVGMSTPFIQLPTALPTAHSRVPTGDDAWQIVLALGNGIELRLTRGMA